MIETFFAADVLDSGKSRGLMGDSLTAESVLADATGSPVGSTFTTTASP